MELAGHLGGEAGADLLGDRVARVVQGEPHLDRVVLDRGGRRHERDPAHQVEVDDAHARAVAGRRQLALERPPCRVEQLGAADPADRSVERDLADRADPLEAVHRGEVGHVDRVLGDLLPHRPDRPREATDLGVLGPERLRDVPHRLDGGVGVPPEQQVPVAHHRRVGPHPGLAVRPVGVGDGDVGAVGVVTSTRGTGTRGSRRRPARRRRGARRGAGSRRRTRATPTRGRPPRRRATARDRSPAPARG